MPFLNLSTYGDVPVDLDAGSAEMQPVEIGGRRRAVSGVMHSTVRRRLRRWRVRLARVTRMKGDAILAGLQSSMPIVCSGDLIDPYASRAVRCDAEVTNIQHPKHAGGEYQLIEFVLQEVGLEQVTTAPWLWRHAPWMGPGIATVTRTGSVAAYQDYDRLLKHAPPNVLRTTWRSVNGVLRQYTRFERPGTNVYTRSEDISHADWQKFGLAATPVVANQGTGPDGVASMDRIVESNVNETHGIYQEKTMTADAPYAASFWFRAETRSWVRLQISDATSTNGVRAWLNLTTGAKGSSAVLGTGVLVGYEIEDWGGGLYRCWLDAVVGSGVTTVRGIAALSSADAAVSYAGDGTSSLLVGYAQFEDNVREPSSYIPTTTIAASRGAESFTDSFPYTPQQLAAMGGGTLYLDFFEGLVPNWVTEAAATRLSLAIVGASGGSVPRLELYRGTGTNDYFFLHNNGVGQVSSSPNLTPGRGERVRLAAHFRSDGSVQMFGRLTGGVDVSGTLTAALTPASAWNQSVPLIRIGGASSTAGRGIQEYADAAWLPGLLSIDECEERLVA